MEASQYVILVHTGWLSILDLWNWMKENKIQYLLAHKGEIVLKLHKF